MNAAPRGRDERAQPAVFLDRDGTLTEENDWVRSPQDLVLLPGAAIAVKTLRSAGYATVLVTNQSAVARGYVSEAELAIIHDHLRSELARFGATLDAVYYCPHHPSEGEAPYRRACECRKPGAGLLRDAARDLHLDLERSWIVGDAERDLLCGAELGVRGVLVATGKGRRERERLESQGRAPDLVAPDVLAAAQWIVANDQVR